jgi:hypothetical protein
MKKVKKAILFLLLFLTGICLYAQGPPDPPGNHGSGNDHGPGGNASLVSGTMILLGLGFAYGAKKCYDKLK